MTPRRQLFVAEYIADGCRNATQAAIRAGFSPKWAGTYADRLVNDPEAVAAIAAARKQIAAKLDITKERVAAARARIAFFADIPPEEQAKLPEVKTSDINAACEGLCKMFGYNEPDKTQLIVDQWEAAFSREADLRAERRREAGDCAASLGAGAVVGPRQVGEDGAPGAAE